MSHHVPTTAFVLSLIGGIFVFLAGLVLAYIASFLAFFGFGLGGILYIGLVVGILMIVFSILLYVMPQAKTAWGALIIVLSIVSLPFALGGFIVGFILGLIGGIFAITYKPPMMAPMMGQPMMGQPMMGQPMMGQPTGAPLPVACPACGGQINPQTRTCMSCGRAV